MKQEIVKFVVLTLVLGSIINLLVDSQNIANALIKNVPIMGRLLRDLELDHFFMNLPFIHNDVTKIRFLLFTQKNPSEEQELSLEDPASFQRSNFNPNQPVKFLIHGYLQSAHSWDFPISLKDAYLHHGGQVENDDDIDGKSIGVQPYNIICVDWSVLSKEMIYFMSAVHTAKVGQRVGQFIAFLRHAQLIPNYKALHIVGFSLGGHVAGIAGSFIQQLTNGTESVGRITGLDPAGPGFESVPADIRLDSGDADFVDVIHSNAGSLLYADWGTWKRLGSVDFFVNGGSRQPACGTISLLTEFSIPRKVACHHLKAAEYFKRTVQGEVMTGCLWNGLMFGDSDLQEGQQGDDNLGEDEVTVVGPLGPCSFVKKSDSNEEQDESKMTAIMGEYCDPNSRGLFHLFTN